MRSRDKEIAAEWVSAHIGNRETEYCTDPPETDDTGSKTPESIQILEFSDQPEDVGAYTSREEVPGAMIRDLPVSASDLWFHHFNGGRA